MDRNSHPPIDSQLAAVTTPWGDRLLVRPDPQSRQRGLQAGVEWGHVRRSTATARHETRLLLGLVQPGMTVVDLGAKFGYCTMLFAHRVGPHGHVFAIEPEYDNFQTLLANLQLNSYKMVAPIRTAVLDSSGPAVLWISRTNLGRHSIIQANVPACCSSEMVTGISLDELWRTQFKQRHIHLLKIDVEGSEARVINGGETTISRHVAMIWMELWPDGLRQAGDSPLLLLEHLVEFGFDLSMLDLFFGEHRKRIAPVDVLAYCDNLATKVRDSSSSFILPIVYLLCTRAT